jgi:hypothetical protein
MDVETPTGGEEVLPSRRFYRPADYYSSPSPERAFPSGVTYGCGGASLAVLIIVFAGGAFLARGGFIQVIDMVLGVNMGQMRGMYAKNVTPAQKRALDTEMETLRRNLRETKISVATLQPLLEQIRKTTADKTLDAHETDALVESARKVNRSARAPKPAKP